MEVLRRVILQSKIQPSPTPESVSQQHQRTGLEDQSACVILPPLELQFGVDDLMTRSMNPDIAALKINVASEGLLSEYLE